MRYALVRASTRVCIHTDHESALTRTPSADNVLHALTNAGATSAAHRHSVACPTEIQKGSDIDGNGTRISFKTACAPHHPSARLANHNRPIHVTSTLQGSGVGRKQQSSPPLIIGSRSMTHGEQILAFALCLRKSSRQPGKSQRHHVGCSLRNHSSSKSGTFQGYQRRSNSQRSHSGCGHRACLIKWICSRLSAHPQMALNNRVRTDLILSCLCSLL